MQSVFSFVLLQEVVTVLQTHHAVQTLPEVGPEFTQAIVQTDISGPITASELTNASLRHSKFTKPDTDLQTRVLAQRDSSADTVNPTSLEPVGVQTVDSGELDSHGGLPASLAQSELQVQSSDDSKDEQAIKQTEDLHLATSHIGHSKTEFTTSQETGRGENSVPPTSVAYTSPPFQGKYFPICVA